MFWAVSREFGRTDLKRKQNLGSISKKKWYLTPHLQLLIGAAELYWALNYTE
jgi:hypothetical protein